MAILVYLLTYLLIYIYIYIYIYILVRVLTYAATTENSPTKTVWLIGECRITTQPSSVTI